MFCLLPLKMESDLKFHVNGHFALNYESREVFNSPFCLSICVSELYEI